MQRVRSFLAGGKQDDTIRQQYLASFESPPRNATGELRFISSGTFGAVYLTDRNTALKFTKGRAETIKAEWDLAKKAGDAGVGALVYGEGPEISPPIIEDLGEDGFYPRIGTIEMELMTTDVDGLYDYLLRQGRGEQMEYAIMAMGKQMPRLIDALVRDVNRSCLDLKPGNALVKVDYGTSPVFRFYLSDFDEEFCVHRVPASQAPASDELGVMLYSLSMKFMAYDGFFGDDSAFVEQVNRSSGSPHWFREGARPLAESILEGFRYLQAQGQTVRGLSDLMGVEYPRLLRRDKIMTEHYKGNYGTQPFLTNLQKWWELSVRTPDAAGTPSPAGSSSASSGAPSSSEPEGEAPVGPVAPQPVFRTPLSSLEYSDSESADRMEE